jgi:hypothetical protein
MEVYNSGCSLTLTLVGDPQTGATLAASATRPDRARILATLRKHAMPRTCTGHS